jgi:hypothetical protein
MQRLTSTPLASHSAVGAVSACQEPVLQLPEPRNHHLAGQRRQGCRCGAEGSRFSRAAKHLADTDAGAAERSHLLLQCVVAIAGRPTPRSEVAMGWGHP